MTTGAVRAQVAAKWQESFMRINQGQPGISGLLSLSEAWNLAAEFLYPHDIATAATRPPLDLGTVRPAFETLSKSRMLPMLLENFLEDVRKQQYLITTDIVKHMGPHEVKQQDYDGSVTPAAVARLIARLVRWYETWRPPPELGSTIHAAYTVTFQTHVFSALPPSFTIALKELIAWTLAPPAEEEDEDGNLIDIPSQIKDGTIWSHFDTLGLIDRYETLIASVCYEYIEAHVLEECTGQWAEPMLASLRSWMGNTVVPWMVMPYARGAKTADEARNMLQGIGSRFDFHVCKTLCDLRTKEIFDIIVDYPNSDGALQDLRECLQRVDQRSQLVRNLRLVNKKRLLHPGADTRTVIQQYVLMILSLRQVDPPGVLLYKVADPIRRYLRDRPDTIRCIVANLVGDDDLVESLVGETEPIQPLQVPQAEDYNDPNWEPEPIDAGPEFRMNRHSDIVSTLVSIYDSRDLFVKDLQVLLAKRLLAVKDGNFDEERRYVEILKIRFGEAALQVCEVMLRDMTDSKRIDQHIQARDPSTLHPTIVSEHFWPNLQQGRLSMPGQLKKIQDAYVKEFIAFKPDKRLRWLPLLGTVSIELELEDRKINAEVSPLAAAFIELFSEQSVWNLDDLVGRVGLKDKHSSTKALSVWVELGVLREDKEQCQYTLLEVAEAGSVGKRKVDSQRTGVTPEEPEPVASVQQQQAEQMKMYWKFIEGMLRNLGSLPLDRVQAMLKLAPGYNYTVDQLAGFMEMARREGLVSVNDGKWKLN